MNSHVWHNGQENKKYPEAPDFFLTLSASGISFTAYPTYSELKTMQKEIGDALLSYDVQELHANQPIDVLDAIKEWSADVDDAQPTQAEEDDALCDADPQAIREIMKVYNISRDRAKEHYVGVKRQERYRAAKVQAQQAAPIPQANDGAETPGELRPVRWSVFYRFPYQATRQLLENGQVSSGPYADREAAETACEAANSLPSDRYFEVIAI